MGYASNVITSRGLALTDSRTQKSLLHNPISIHIPYPTDIFFERREIKDLVKVLFLRKNLHYKRISYSDIKKWGWIICEAPYPEGYKKWFPGQQVYYYLQDENIPVKPSAIPLTELPRNHQIGMSIRKRKIRIEGRNAGPNGRSRWKYIDPKDSKKMHEENRKYARRSIITIMRRQRKKSEVSR